MYEWVNMTSIESKSSSMRMFLCIYTHTHIQMKQMCSSHVSTDGQTTTTETTVVVVVIYIDKNIQTTENKKIKFV